MKTKVLLSKRISSLKTFMGIFLLLFCVLMLQAKTVPGFIRKYSVQLSHKKANTIEGWVLNGDSIKEIKDRGGEQTNYMALPMMCHTLKKYNSQEINQVVEYLRLKFSVNLRRCWI